LVLFLFRGLQQAKLASVFWGSLGCPLPRLRGEPISNPHDRATRQFSGFDGISGPPCPDFPSRPSSSSAICHSQRSTALAFVMDRPRRGARRIRWLPSCHPFSSAHGFWHMQHNRPPSSLASPEYEGRGTASAHCTTGGTRALPVSKGRILRGLRARRQAPSDRDGIGGRLRLALGMRSARRATHTSAHFSRALR
jgi:hypothetical protein